MSYSRSPGMGAVSPAFDPAYLSRGTLATLNAGAGPTSSGGLTGSRVLLLAALGGAAFLVWRKLHKKAPSTP